MKIVEYLHTTSGGHMHYTSALSEALREQGVEASVLAGRDAKVEPHVWPFVPVPDVSAKPMSVGWVLNRLSTYARQPRAIHRAMAEVVVDDGSWFHMQQVPPLGAGRLIGKLRARGWRVAITVHNVSAHERNFLAQRLHTRQTRSWSKADVLVVHSPRLIDPLLRQLPGSRSPTIAVVAHPVWREERLPDLLPARDFLFFGHLRPNKGVEDFVTALVAMGDPPATIAGAGSEDEVAALRMVMSRSGLENCAVRLGFVPDGDVPRLFADHRVVVAPYRGFEAQSGVTHLAIAHRRPIVVTDVGALGDLVRDFGVGEIVSANEALSEAMGRARARMMAGRYDSRLDAAAFELDPATIARRLIDRLEDA